MKHKQDGSINFLFLFIVSLSLFFLALIFGIWSYAMAQKYKNNVDQIVSQKVSVAKSQQQTADNKAFAIEQQNPYTTYYGPQDYGSLNISYPKNWSSYVNTGPNSNYPIDGYFFPGTLPSVNESDPVDFALRIRVINTPYSQELQQYSSFQKGGNVTISAYSLPKLPSIVGVKVVGKLIDNNQKTGTVIILPLRNGTLEFWTEGSQYQSTFINNILPSISFSP